VADAVLQFLYRVLIWFVYCTFQVSPENISLGTLEKYGTRIKSAHDTGTEGQHQPRSCSHQNHCYIGYTSTWLDVRSCVLMQEATTLNIIYDDISFQHLATVLISVFTLCYGPGLLFCGLLCIIATEMSPHFKSVIPSYKYRKTVGACLWVS